MLARRRRCHKDLSRPVVLFDVGYPRPLRSTASPMSRTTQRSLVLGQATSGSLRPRFRQPSRRSLRQVIGCHTSILLRGKLPAKETALNGGSRIDGQQRGRDGCHPERRKPDRRRPSPRRYRGHPPTSSSRIRQASTSAAASSRTNKAPPPPRPYSATTWSTTGRAAFRRCAACRARTGEEDVGRPAPAWSPLPT